MNSSRRARDGMGPPTIDVTYFIRRVFFGPVSTSLENATANYID
jgi:hypothetical protein